MEKQNIIAYDYTSLSIGKKEHLRKILNVLSPLTTIGAANSRFGFDLWKSKSLFNLVVDVL